MAEPNGNLHRYDLRVYYEDTDAGGIVYYANYLGYAERARAEMLRELGVESSRLMRDNNVVLAVRWCSVDYLRPAVLDDHLVIETSLQRLGGATLEVIQIVRRQDVDLVRIDLKLGCVSLCGGAARLPLAVREKLGDHLNSNGS